MSVAPDKLLKGGTGRLLEIGQLASISDRLLELGFKFKEKPKRYRTFLFFGPQNQLKREKTRRNFLNLTSKKCSFCIQKKNQSCIQFPLGGKLNLPLVYNKQVVVPNCPKETH